MPLNFHVPLPGPFSYTRRISGDGSGRVLKGLGSFFWLLFFVPIWICFAIFWWTLVSIAYVAVFVWQFTVDLVKRFAHRRPDA